MEISTLSAQLHAVDRPSRDNPESVGSRNSYSRINGSTDLSNFRFSKKSRGLETSQNSHKSDQRFPPSGLSRPQGCKNGMTVSRIPNTCKRMLVTLINIIITAGLGGRLQLRPTSALAGDCSLAQRLCKAGASHATDCRKEGRRRRSTRRHRYTHRRRVATRPRTQD
jgi:hypothetical protein